MHFGNLPDLVITLNEGTGMLSGNFHHGFIGHHFNHYIILGNIVTGINVPFNDFTFDNAFANVWQYKRFYGAARRFRRRPLNRFLRRFLSCLRYFGLLLQSSATIITRRLKFKQRRVHFGNITWLIIQPGNNTIVDSRYLYRGFVGHHLCHRLVLFYRITFTDQPFERG